MLELDDNMEQQIKYIEGFRNQEGDRLARDHLWAKRYSMWEEASIAKRTSLGKELEQACNYYHSLRGTALFVFPFVIYLLYHFLVLCLSDILNCISGIFSG